MRFSFKIIPQSDANEYLWLSVTDTLTRANREELCGAIANKIYDLRKMGIYLGEHVIIRDGITKQSAMTVAEVRRAFVYWKDRIGCQTLQFLTTNSKSSRNITVWRSEGTDPLPIDEIADSFLGYSIISGESLYRLNNDDVFELPGRQFSQKFFRIGNIQRVPHLLDDIFLFLMPYIKDVKAIVAETWSISSLCYHIADRMAMRSGDAPPVVHFLTRYFDDSNESQTELAQLLATLLLSKSSPTAVIFSATFTGNSWQRVKSRLRDGLTDPKALRPIALVGLSTTSKIQSLSKLPYESTQSIDVANSRVMPINPRTYFPDFVNPINVPILPHIKEYKDFFERYASRGIFHVHCNSHSVQSFFSRHNAFYVKFDQMVGTEEFAKRLELAISGCIAPRTTIFLETTSNLKLVELTEAYFGCKTTRICGVRFEDIEEAINGIGPAEIAGPIWVVDSITVTGATLGQFMRLAREQLKGLHISILIGLDRPDRKSHLLSRANSSMHVTGTSGKYLAVESVVLPNWGADRCPWCRELRLLQGIPNMGDASIDRNLNGRRNFLHEAVREGRDNGLFFFDADKKGNVNALFDLGERSFFLDTTKVSNGAEISEGDVLCCVAAVAQLWRARETGPFYRRAVVSSESTEAIVPINNTIGPTTFNDPVLRAALWRVFGLREIIPTTGDERENYIQDFSKIAFDAKESMYSVLCIEAALLLGDHLRQEPALQQALTAFERYLVANFLNPRTLVPS